MGSAIAIAVIVVAIFAYAITSGRKDKSSEKELLQLCRGDHRQAERLIAHAQERGKRLDRQQAIKAAIDAHKRDNR